MHPLLAWFLFRYLMNPDPANKIYFILICICTLLVSGCEKDDFISSQPDSNIIFISGHYENSTGWDLMLMRKDGSHQSMITDLTTIYENRLFHIRAKQFCLYTTPMTHSMSYIQ